MVVFGDDIARLLMNLRRGVVQIVVSHALNVERRRFGGKWLRPGGAFAGDARGRHRPFLDRPHRLAGDAVENIDEGLLGHLRDRLDALSADADIDQIGRGRRVVIPQPVMHELIVPDLLAGRRIEAHQAVAIEAIAGTVAAVVVVGRR
jgi:hypothetical protein